MKFYTIGYTLHNGLSVSGSLGVEAESPEQAVDKFLEGKHKSIYYQVFAMYVPPTEFYEWINPE